MKRSKSLDPIGVSNTINATFENLSSFEAFSTIDFNRLTSSDVSQIEEPKILHKT